MKCLQVLPILWSYQELQINKTGKSVLHSMVHKTTNSANQVFLHINVNEYKKCLTAFAGSLPDQTSTKSVKWCIGYMEMFIYGLI